MFWKNTAINLKPIIVTITKKYVNDNMWKKEHEKWPLTEFNKKYRYQLSHVLYIEHAKLHILSIYLGAIIPSIAGSYNYK